MRKNPIPEALEKNKKECPLVSGHSFSMLYAECRMLNEGIANAMELNGRMRASAPTITYALLSKLVGAIINRPHILQGMLTG